MESSNSRRFSWLALVPVVSLLLVMSGCCGGAEEKQIDSDTVSTTPKSGDPAPAARGATGGAPDLSSLTPMPQQSDLPKWVVDELSTDVELCQQRVGEACLYLGNACAENADGHVPNPEASTALLRRACELGEPEACEKVGVKLVLEPVTQTAMGVEWVVEAEISYKVLLKKIECDSSTRECELTIEYPGGWGELTYKPKAFEYDKDGVRLDTDILDHPDDDSSVRDTMYLDEDTTRVVIKKD